MIYRAPYEKLRLDLVFCFLTSGRPLHSSIPRCWPPPFPSFRMEGTPVLLPEDDEAGGKATRLRRKSSAYLLFSEATRKHMYQTFGGHANFRDHFAKKYQSQARRRRKQEEAAWWWGSWGRIRSKKRFFFESHKSVFLLYSSNHSVSLSSSITAEPG